MRLDWSRLTRVDELQQGRGPFECGLVGQLVFRQMAKHRLGPGEADARSQPARILAFGPVRPDFVAPGGLDIVVGGVFRAPHRIKSSSVIVGRGSSPSPGPAMRELQHNPGRVSTACAASSRWSWLSRSNSFSGTSPVIAHVLLGVQQQIEVLPPDVRRLGFRRRAFPG